MTNRKTRYALLCAAALAILAGTVRAGDGHDHDHDHSPAETARGEAEGDHAHGDEHGHNHEEEGVVRLSAAQIEQAGIAVVPVTAGAVGREIAVPGRIIADESRMAQVVPRVAGTVAAVRKNLGDTVEKDETLAEIESREMADAVATYRAAVKSAALARSTLKREKSLWEQKITAEQDYLAARNAHAEAAIAAELAGQKLKTLGYDAKDDKGAVSRFHALRAPIAGRVIARDIVPGAFADTAKAAFTIADLSAVWVESAVPAADLGHVSEGQAARVRGDTVQGEGKVVFLSPAIDADTGAAKAIIAIDNADGAWRPGQFVTAALPAGTGPEARLSVPREAVQTVDGQAVLFVRNAEGFEKRAVVTGRAGGARVEILSGVAAGETVAAANSFTLKAELGKAEAEHAH